MSLSIGSLTNIANQSLTPLEQYSRQLLDNVDRATTGSNLSVPGANPSGLAIANELESQASGFNAGAENAQIASSALNVAQGALQTTQNALQSLNSLAVQATNDLLSPNQRQTLQTVANQLVQQINTDAQNATFNGQPLLQGPQTQTPPTAANANVVANANLAAGGTLITSATASPTAQAGTISAIVVPTGNGTSGVDLEFTSTATGQTTDLGVQAAGSTVNVNGTTVTLGNAGTQDESVSATVQVQAASAGNAGSGLNVQTGANEGATTQVTLPNGTSSGLFIQNLDLSTTQSAENAQGQIQQALSAVSQAQSNLGAQQGALNTQVSSNATASNALTASASSISDADMGSTSTEFYQLLLQQQVSLDTLKNANTQFGYLNRFFNTAS